MNLIKMRNGCPRFEEGKKNSKLSGGTKIAISGDYLRPDVKQVKNYWLCGNWVLQQDDGGCSEQRCWFQETCPGSLLGVPNSSLIYDSYFPLRGRGLAVDQLVYLRLLPASDNEIKSSLGLVLTIKK